LSVCDGGGILLYNLQLFTTYSCHCVCLHHTFIWHSLHSVKIKLFYLVTSFVWVHIQFCSVCIPPPHVCWCDQAYNCVLLIILFVDLIESERVQESCVQVLGMKTPAIQSVMSGCRSDILRKQLCSGHSLVCV